MAGYVEKGVIRLHEKVGHDIWRMQIELPQTAKSALPGQFIHIKLTISANCCGGLFLSQALNREKALWKLFIELLVTGRKPWLI